MDDTLNIRMPRCLQGILLGLALLLTPSGSEAQDRAAVGMLGGITQYDLDGVGEAPHVSIRGSSALDRPIVFEGALSYFSYFTQGQGHIWHVLPEVQVQWQYLRSHVHPYAGAGLGASHGRSGEASTTDLTLSVSGGLRVPVARGWYLVGEVRVRSIDPWTGSNADIGVGIVGRL